MRLKCGVLDKGVFEETESGTPQGGVISPLLANIALHGMIDDIVNHFPCTKRRKDGRSRIRLPWIQHQVIPYWETPLCQNRMEEKPRIQNSNQTQQEENTSSSRGNQRGYQNQ